MKVYFDIPFHPNREKALQEFRGYMQRRGFHIETTQAEAQENQMGPGGWITGLAAVFTGGLFGKLGEAVVEWVKNYRTDLTLKNEKGQEISISSTLDKEDIFKLIDRFMNTGGDNHH